MTKFLALTIAAAALTGQSPDGSIDVRDVAAERPPAVSVLLQVLDGAGRPVPGLGVADFSVFEDGHPVQGLAVRQSHPDESPVAVSLLLDTSGSMTPDAVAAAVAGSKALLAKLAPTDRSELVSFDSSVRLLNDYATPTDPAILDALAPLKGGHTTLNDAILRAIERAQSETASARAIVVLTDGKDDGSSTPLQTLLEAIDPHLPIYTIGLGPNVDAGFLQGVADASGGQFQAAATPSDLAALYATIAASLQTDYLLSYQTTETSGGHVITIVVRTPTGEASSDVRFRLPDTAPSKDDDGAGFVAFAVIGGALAIVGVSLPFLLRRSRRARPTRAGASPAVSWSPDQFHLVGAEATFPLVGAGIVVGRDPRAHIVIDDSTVSRTHARIDVEPGGVWVEDLGSSNGTTINGVPVQREFARSGDILEFGDQRLELRGPS